MIFQNIGLNFKQRERKRVLLKYKNNKAGKGINKRGVVHISKSKIIIAIAVAIIVLISGVVLVVSLAGGNSASKQIELETSI